MFKMKKDDILFFNILKLIYILVDWVGAIYYLSEHKTSI